MSHLELDAKIDEVIALLEKNHLVMYAASDINGWTYKLRYNPKKDERLRGK